MDESLDFSLSWDRLAYNVEKSNVAIDLADLLFMLLNVSVRWVQNFVRPKN